MWFVGKNPTKFGLMVHEIWLAEVHKFLKLNWSYLANHPWDLRVLGLFENGRTRSSTFMLGKNSFEAYLMLESWVEVEPKTFHFWKLEIIGHFPFLETFDLTSNSSMLIFEMINKHDLDMNGMKKLNSQFKTHSWLFSWLHWSLDDLKMSWWIRASTIWEFAPKWTYSSHKLKIMITWSISQWNPHLLHRGLIWIALTCWLLKLQVTKVNDIFLYIFG